MCYTTIIQYTKIEIMMTIDFLSLYMLSCWTKYYHISWFCQNINEESGLQQTKSLIFSRKSEIKGIMTKNTYIYSYLLCSSTRHEKISCHHSWLHNNWWKMKNENNCVSRQGTSKTVTLELKATPSHEIIKEYISNPSNLCKTTVSHRPQYGVETSYIAHKAA